MKMTWRYMEDLRTISIYHGDDPEIDGDWRWSGDRWSETDGGGGRWRSPISACVYVFGYKLSCEYPTG